MTWWIEFESPVTLPDGRRVGAACVHGDSREAEDKAARFGKVKKMWVLPYGAAPALDGERMGDFCLSPEECKGRGSCPRNYACSE